MLPHTEGDGTTNASPHATPQTPEAEEDAETRARTGCGTSSVWRRRTPTSRDWPRTIFVARAPGFVTWLAADSNRIHFLPGHVSIQTTERYLGCRQNLRCAVNDRLRIEPDASA